jgi:peptidyl-prolyl cis-trans isomerase D
MLQLIRDKAQGIIIWIIVGLVILALSSFILNSYLGSSVKNYVAKVNDQEISDREYQMAFNNYQQQLRQALGDNFGKFFNEKMMRQNVVSGLITNALMQQLTTDAGFRTSPQQIAKQIENNPAFKEDGKFSDTRYQQTLARVGYSPARFEAEVAHSQAQKQFEDGLSDSAFVLKSDVDEYLRLSQQQRDVGYLLVKMAEIRKGVTISDADIKQYYDAHLSDFMTDEQVKVSYLELNMQDLAKSIKVDDAELKAYYKDHQASYTRDDFASAEKKIDELAARIKKGEDFAKLAKEYSQDPGSAIKGGDLGFFSRGMMVKPFEDAAFKLKVGEVSKPVRTQYGYHLIKLEAIRNQGKEERRVRHILIKPGKITKPYDEVKDQIKLAVQMKHAESIFYQDADKLDRLSYEYQDSLDPAAEQLGLKIQESPFFSRSGGPQIWHNPDVIKAAFSDDVLKGGLNSELIKLSDDHMLVLRLKEHKPAAQKPLTEVKQQIEERLKNDKASEQAAALADKLAKEIQAGSKPDKLASENSAVSWYDVGFIGRQAQYDADKNSKDKISAEIRKQVFLLAKPEAKPVVVSNKLADGDAAVIELRAVRDNPAMNDKAKQEEAIQRQMLQAEAEVQKRLVLEHKRANSKIDINKQQDSDQDS